jgi:hypothetical protein
MLPKPKQTHSILDSKLFQIRNIHVLNALRRKSWQEVEAKNSPMSKK